MNLHCCRIIRYIGGALQRHLHLSRYIDSLDSDAPRFDDEVVFPMFLYLGFKCLIIDVEIEAVAVLMVDVSLRYEFPSFSVNCPVVAHLYLSDQCNLTSISTYCDRC